MPQLLENVLTPPTLLEIGIFHQSFLNLSFLNANPARIGADQRHHSPLHFRRGGLGNTLPIAAGTLNISLLRFKSDKPILRKLDPPVGSRHCIFISKNPKRQIELPGTRFHKYANVFRLGGANLSGKTLPYL